MKRTILKITACTLFAAAMVAAPVLSRAQDATSTNAPAMTDQTSVPIPVQTTNAPVKKARKHDRLVFNGKLASVDTNAMTLTVGTRTFEITSDTKIVKDGKPATLSDGVVGGMAAGSYKKAEGGKLDALTVRFGEKKKKEPTESTGSTTNSVSN
jgi:hypothetical protein